MSNIQDAQTAATRKGGLNGRGTSVCTSTIACATYAPIQITGVAPINSQPIARKRPGPRTNRHVVDAASQTSGMSIAAEVRMPQRK